MCSDCARYFLCVIARVNVTSTVQYFLLGKVVNILRVKWHPGGHSTFFQVGVCGPDFRSVGICLWKGGLVSGKFPNLGAWELKISKFGGLWAKIWVKIEAVEAKISKFSQKGVLWTDSFAWNGTLARGRWDVKRGSSGPNIPIPPF